MEDYYHITHRMTDENREHIQAWVAALRSGKFDQAQKSLKTEGGHCCLGVACEIFKEQTGRGEWEQGGKSLHIVFAVKPTDEEIIEFDVNPINHLWSDSMTLPISVANWLFGSRKETNPSADFLDKEDSEYDKDGIVSAGLAECNDDGCPFEEIADAIERTYLK